MHGTRRIVGGALLAILAVLALTACGGASEQGGDQPPAGQSSGTFPVTITHALGEATISAAPTRIVALSYEQDLLSQIGITTVGHNENAVTPGRPYPWEEGKVDFAGSEVVVEPSQEVNLEKIAALQPDLILATNLSTIDKFYPQLSQIAPTVVYQKGWNKDTWQDNAALIGKAVGKEADVARVVQGVEKKISDTSAAIPGLQGKTYATAYYYERGTFVVPTDSTTTMPQVYAALGLRIDPEIAANVMNRSLSAEQIGLLDVDYLSLSFANADLRSQLFADPLFANLDVVKQQRYFESDEAGGVAENYPTVLNIPWTIDRQLDVLKKVGAATG
ncbi:ABC transporter substrate-binding protein [Pseudonocardia sp. HH130629-09]|uniref:ABC transporter substrate-binding protein n=1 Tax=Pseudonocardia sp. HH130629-09 TaxID=1641402 RepID=UPI0006CB3599|nr:ABC transporter substrate-binding protein [Pseudonocardia sp. HH130629-09]ALE84044.1 hypothetical protein XF36_13570 [Pseudonocardia sp. HH130629-09]